MKGMVDEEEEDDIDSETGSMMRKISSPRSSNQVDNGSNVFVTDFFNVCFALLGSASDGNVKMVMMLLKFVERY